MTTDNYSGVTGITYDRRSLPLSMTKGTETYTYRYNDKGERTRKVMGTANEYYLHDHTGRELAVWDKSTNTLKMVNLYGAGMLGRVEINGTTYSTYYYIKDHLGSIRQTLNSSGTVVSGQDYYPYGSYLRSYVSGSESNGKYRFTEKERDALTNYDYFGARYYISKLGRWMAVDPLAAKYPGWSPYNYVKNNPLILIDPNGKEITKPDNSRILNMIVTAYKYSSTYRKMHDAMLARKNQTWNLDKLDMTKRGAKYARAETTSQYYKMGGDHMTNTTTSVNLEYLNKNISLTEQIEVAAHELAHAFEQTQNDNNPYASFNDYLKKNYPDIYETAQKTVGGVCTENAKEIGLKAASEDEPLDESDESIIERIFTKEGGN